MNDKKQATYSKMGISLEIAMISFGIYFLGRVIRTQLYYPLIDLFFPAESPIYQILEYFAHFIFLAVLLIYVKLRPQNNPSLKEMMGDFSTKTTFLFIFGLICGFAANGSAILVAILHKDIDMVWKGANPVILIFALLAVCFQSSVEEIQYRGWMCNRLLKEATFNYAVIVSAIVFSLVHALNRGISFVALFNIFLIGIISALSLKVFGNTYFACAYHTAWNFTQNFIFGLPNSGYPAVTTLMAPTYTYDSLFYDAEFGVEATAYTSVMNVVIIIIFILISKSRQKIGAK